MKLNLLLLLFITMGSAQEKGTVSGVLTNKNINSESLPFANVLIKNTNIGVSTDSNGKYSITLAPGSYTIIFSFLGYEDSEVTFNIEQGEKKIINQALIPDNTLLDDVVIKKSNNREKESALLLEQQKAIRITQSIGAQELSRKGLNNAGTAVTRMTGISRQDGNGGVFVRGLGDRYNSTTLNELPLPSNEPENKNVTLDLFSSEVIQSIDVSKTYNTHLYGDMGGANIDIISKEHRGGPQLKIEIGNGLNNNAVGTDFKVADGIKKLGFYNVKLPNRIDQYQFETRWDPNREGKPINSNIGISGGTSFDVGSEGKISAFANAAYENGYRFKNGFQRIVSRSNDDIPIDFYNINKYEFASKTTMSANIGYKINSKNKLKINSLFINASRSTVGEYDSFVGQGDDRFEFTRQTLTEQNQLFINQFLGDHTITNRLDFKWGGSYGIVNADMPDRITNNLLLDNGVYSYNTNSPASNNRYFQSINENEIAARALFTYKVLNDGNDDYKGKIVFGYNGRMKSRDFEATQFNFRITNNNIYIPVTRNTIDDFLNPNYLSTSPNIDGTFNITTGRITSLRPFTYTGDLTVNAGILGFEQNVSHRMSYTIGIRGEQIIQKMTWNTNISLSGVTFKDATIDKVFLLPTASLKYTLKENQNLRLALSKTYTLPEFKEKAPFRYEGVGENSVGNPFLQPSDNYNLDLKWELFPNTDEIISVTGFGKYLKNPISKVLLNSALNDNTFVNAGDYAYVVGAEFEIRKNIWEVDEKQSLAAGFNFTYMYSEQKLDSEKVANETNNSVNFNSDIDKLQGASPLLVNADISYIIKEGSFRPTISLVGNYFHDRIYSLGSFDRGNIVEKGIPTLNLITSAKVGENLTLTFNAKNILDSKIRRVQENTEGSIDVFSFKPGLDLSFGIKYDIF